MAPSKEKSDKMQQDLSGQAQEVIEKQTQIANSGNLKEAVEALLIMEKQTRLAEDALSTSKLAVTIVRLCFQQESWDYLNQNLQILSKRRGQLQTVIQDFVEESMTNLEKVTDRDVKMQLLEILRTITEGKIFVENQRARLTKILAKMKEEEGKIAEAAEILQEVQVETFGQMDKFEKTDFIIEQMRLCLDKKDYIKAQILSNKISRKALNADDFQDLKLRYFEQMVRYYGHDSKYLEVCKCYRAIYDTPKVKEDESQWKKYLQLSVIYIILSPFENEQSDLMNRINQDKLLNQLPNYQQILKLFLTKELMRYPQFEELYKEEFNKFSIFTELVDAKNPLWTDLQKRVVEHNIRVIAEYYSKITCLRLTQLLDLPYNEAEKFISDLVVSKSIFARIDRPKGIISFRKTKDPNESLNDWSSNVNDLLGLLEKTTHLIHRELMVHKINV